MAQHINNNVILKNSLFLYVRMFILMIVGFITVRIVLQALGIVDYGIYNVVGGVVAMFSFLQGSLTTASQRYFSIEIAKKDVNALSRVFSLNLTVFLLLATGVIVIAETVGLWFINTRLTIPADRLTAANIVYQFSILAFLFNLISIPYNALIVSYERMKAFAWLGLAEGLVKLAVGCTILFAKGDRLIEYSILMAILSIAVTITYIIYCTHQLPGSKFAWYWNKQDAQELFAFSGWHFLGTISVVIRGTGVNLLINTFFSPVVNAGRSIGYQIEHVVGQFSSNYFTAVKPQMYKAYSMGEMNDLFKLINRSTLLSMFLISIFAFPLLLNMPFVLNLWLGEVPDYAVAFGSLALINAIIDATGSPTIAPALAHGKIRNFEIGIASVAILNLPISYYALRMGYSPEITVVISIVLSLIALVVRVLFLRNMMDFPLRPFGVMMFKIALLSIVAFIPLKLAFSSISDGWLKFVFSSTISMAVVAFVYLLSMTKADRKAVIRFVQKK